MQYKLAIVLLLLVMSVIAVFSMDSSATKIMIINANAQIGMTPSISPQRVLPTYIIRILPGAALQLSRIHYSPQNVAIPSGTTVAWVNDDPGQPHTIMGN